MRTRTNKRWTQREIEYIREKYPTTKRVALAIELGVSEQVMDSTIRRHGLRKNKRRPFQEKKGPKREKPNKRWTTRDLKILQLLYPTSTIRSIAENMGLSFYSVKNAIGKYNILKNEENRRNTENH